jgi:DNA-binding beta-propeller fold protein YncE
MTRLPRRAILLCVGALALFGTIATALGTTGSLTQPAGTAGCINETGAGPCAQGHGLDSAIGVAVSPDGKSVYAVGAAVARLNRNKTTGAISQPAGTAGCISQTGAGPCAHGHALGGGLQDVAVSPDGKSVYVAVDNRRAVVRLNRNKTTGAITQPAGEAGCISHTGAGPCADGHWLGYPVDLAVSPDGKSVYVASYTGLVRLNRNKATGAISQPAGTAGCISQTGPCAHGHGLDEPVGVAVSPDGKSVYAASGNNNAVLRFNRMP